MNRKKEKIILNDYTTNKTNKEYKYWKKASIGALAIGVVGLTALAGLSAAPAFAGQTALSSIAFLSGTIGTLIGLGVTIPNAWEKKRINKKAHKWLKENADTLTAGTNQFKKEVVDELGNKKDITPTIKDKKNEEEKADEANPEM